MFNNFNWHINQNFRKSFSKFVLEIYLSKYFNKDKEHLLRLVRIVNLNYAFSNIWTFIYFFINLIGQKASISNIKVKFRHFMDKLTKRTRSVFNEIYGNTRNIEIVKSPASIMLLGDHTHYNEGILISAAVDSFVCVAVRKAADNKISVQSNWTELNIKSKTPEYIQKKSDKNFLFRLLSILIDREIITEGIECVIENEIPQCFGLGTVAAVQIGFLYTLNKVYNLQMTEEEIAEFSIESSMESIGKITNRSHHYTIFKAAANSLLSMDLRHGGFKKLDFSSKYKILICDTGIKIKNIHDTCNSRIDECSVGVKGLRLYIWGIKSLRDIKPDFLSTHAKMIPQRVFLRCLYNVRERMRVELATDALNSAEFLKFGSLVSESHESLNVDYDISSAEMNFLVETASQIHGNIGSKMISCSSIRSTFNIVKTSAVQTFTKEITEKYKAKFGKNIEIHSYSIIGGIDSVNKIS